MKTPQSAKGSVLIVAMLLTLSIGIAIVSYINLGQTNLAVSNRAFFNNAAVNLAETGLEQAMWSINKAVDGDPGAWTGWTTDASNAWQDFSGYSFDANATGNVRVYVRNHTLAVAPIIVARATISPVKGPPIEKWIMVTLLQRSLFANGLVAKNTITFSGGNAVVDSYDSRLGAYDAPLGGGSTNKYARGSAGSASVSVGSFSLSNSEIFGFVSIGTSDYTGLNVGPNGIVGDFGAAAGSVDYTRVTTDFTTNFEDASAPATAGYSIGTINGATTLPRGGDLAAADGKFYYDVVKIQLSGPASRKLNISSGNDVVVRITASPGTDGVKLTGNASIQVLGSSSLEMYADSNVSIAGRGVANANDPEAFQFWSTKAAGSAGAQSVSVSGNGNLSAVVYAPNADVTMNGGGASGSVYGAVVADTISVTGGSEFHYDEALAAMSDGNPFGIANWAELTTAAERNAYSPYLSF